MALPTPGVTPANWGAQLNAEISAAQNSAVTNLDKAGNYVTTGFSVGTLGLTLNEATASPFAVHSRGATFDQAAVSVTTAGTAGAVIRLGVYGDSGGYPGALIADWGTVDCTTTGNKTLTISWVPNGGLYWLVGACQGATSTARSNAGANATTPFGLSASTLGNITTGNVTGYVDSGISGALSANWIGTLNERYGTLRVVLRAA